MTMFLLVHPQTGTVINASDDVRVLAIEDGDVIEDTQSIIQAALDYGTRLRLDSTQCPDCDLVGGEHTYNCQVHWIDEEYI